MKDATSRVIYVGKARILRNRVRSYFSGEKDVKTRALVQKIDSIDYIVTATEYEALILESNLVKEYQPRYNIDLKDGKTYPVIRITNEDFPRIFKTRRIIGDGSAYFGPFPSVRTIDVYLEIIDNIIPLRKCHGPLKKRSAPCLYYHIKKCPAPCVDYISGEDYRARAAEAGRLISRPSEDLRNELVANMETASSKLDFEKAARYRDMAAAIDNINSEQKVMDHDPESRDYLASSHYETHSSFVVFKMRNGRLSGTDMYHTKGFGEETELLLQFLTQYYVDSASLPHKLFVPDAEVARLAADYFRVELKADTEIAMPSGSRDTAVMQMARENARQDLGRRLNELGTTPALDELRRIFELPALPRRIEGFDIAQLHGKHTVASLVSFHDGAPDKAAYRRFHIRSLKGAIDDFEAIREAVARRYTRVVNENLPRPDLILIDGGKGQLSSAKSILDALGLQDIPILSLAKREEEVFVPHKSEPVVLPAGHPALRLLQAVRDETHRFATGANQQLRSSDLKLDKLEGIPGLGKKRSTALLTAFGSIQAIAEASMEDLRSAAGISEALARNLLVALGSAPAEETPAGEYAGAESGEELAAAAEGNADYGDD